MIWIILAALGVPLWLCLVAIVTLVMRNRTLRTRGENVPVRRRLAGKTRWRRGHGVWIHDVFAFRGSPAAWSESLDWVATATTRAVTDASEAKKLRRLGERPTVAVLTMVDGSTIEYATSTEHALNLLGPFAADAAQSPSPSIAEPPASGA